MAIQEIGKIAMMFVFIGIMIGIGVWINQEVAHSTFTTCEVTNETVNFAVSNTLYNLAYPYIKTVNHIYNGTAATSVEVPTANYEYTDRQVK